MEAIEALVSFVGWPAIALALFALIPVGLWVHKERIAALQDRLDLRDEELALLKQSSPDILARQYKTDRDLYAERLVELSASKDVTEVELHTAQRQLKQANDRLGLLAWQIDDAKTFLRENALVCRFCGAPLSLRQYFYESVEYGGRDLDINHEVASYDCGLEISDGRVTRPCRWKEDSTAQAGSDVSEGS